MTPDSHLHQPEFVPLVLEDGDGGDLWIARGSESIAGTREKAITKATEIGGAEDWHPVEVWMHSGVWGDENEWEECPHDAEGAQPYWRMEAW